VARFRLGNEVRERYWEEEREKKCILCEVGVKTWEHIWEACRSWKEGTGKSWQEACRRVLGEEGEREEWMREVEEERRREGRSGEDEREEERESEWMGRRGEQE